MFFGSWAWFAIIVIQLWTYMIDLTLTHSSWIINLVALSCHPVNHQYFQVPQFGAQLHKYWHIHLLHKQMLLYKSYCVICRTIFWSSFAYSTSASNNLDHRLWSYWNVWQDRYWIFICITHSTILDWTGLEYLDFHKVLTPNICLHVRPKYMLIPRTKSWGIYSLPPRLALKALPPQFFSCVGL